jgi:hypothetical protein
MTPELHDAGATSRELVLRFSPPADRPRLQALFDIEREITTSGGLRNSLASAKRAHDTPQPEH